MTTLEPDGESTVRTNQTNDDDDASSSSDSSSSSGDTETVGTTDPEEAKSRLRARIRAQAGSLLSNKGPPVAAVSTVKRHSSSSDAPGKRSSSRNLPPLSPVGSFVAPVVDGDESNNNEKQQRTGEESEETKPRNAALLAQDNSNNSSLNDSKRSMVRFEQDVEKGEGQEVSVLSLEANEETAARPSLTVFKSGDADDSEQHDEVVLPDFELKEEVKCSNGANLGMGLCVIFLLTWVIALPIALTNRNKDSSSDEGEMTPTLPPALPPTIPTSAPVPAPTVAVPSTPPSVPPTVPPTVSPTTASPTATPGTPTAPPTAAPTGQPTVTPELLLEFPPYTEEALTDPTSPQSLALEWMYSDPLVFTYTQERQTQRFSLATFYYATQGDNWTVNTNWLGTENQKHECFWYSQVPVCNNRQEYTVLELNDNNLVGEVPQEVALLTSLTDIHLQDNHLGGRIPSTLAELPSLTFLDLQDNKMIGPLPTELGLMSSLNYLWLNGTRDMDSPETPAASIPTELALLTVLRELHMSSNKLSGRVPSELGLLRAMDWVSFRENSLTGQIPSEISLLPTLTWLDLGENRLSGEIPSTIGGLNRTLRILQLESNFLSGTIPDAMNRLTNVETVWLQENMLSGDVPSGLCYFQRIGKVNTIWIDCEEVECSCNCECAAIDNVDSPSTVATPAQTPAPTNDAPGITVMLPGAIAAEEGDEGETVEVDGLIEEALGEDLTLDEVASVNATNATAA